MNKLVIFVFLIVSISTAQSHMYIDDFGNKLSKEQFKELKSQGGIKVKFKNNQSYVGIIPIKYKGIISELVKVKVIKYLENNANFKIEHKETIIISYAINHKCNIVNNINFKKFIKRVSKEKNLCLFMVIDKYDEMVKNQIVDSDELIKDNFFRYAKWNLKEAYKCGGALIIYPDNSFYRVHGEYNPMDVYNQFKSLN